MHPRSLIVRDNIAASVFIKGGSLIVTILLVPLAVGYLDPVRYGIWLTLSSILSWSSFFDVGLGNGLRNKFAEAMAKNDFRTARVYVSTAYIILGAIVSALFVLILMVNPFLDWTRILNAPASLFFELRVLALWAAAFFLLKLLSSLITAILLADQKSAKSDFVNLVGNLLAIVVLYILARVSTGSLLMFGLCLSIIPVLVGSIVTVLLFRGHYKNVSPSFKYLEMGHAKDLANVGIQFFVIQLSVLVIFASGNLIIAQLFGPAEVTPYNIAFRYFNVLTFVFGIIMTPFWSGFTDAYHRKDFVWIKATLRQLIIVWGIGVGVVLVMLSVSGYIYSIWVGKDIKIPFIMSFVMALSVVIVTWNNIFTYFINGVGKIRLQLYASVFMAIVLVPLAVFFAQYANMGPSGVMLATCVCLLSGSILGPIQAIKLIDGTADGIWSK